MLADEAIAFLKEKQSMRIQSFEALAKCAIDNECDNCMCANKRGKVDISDFAKFVFSAAKRDNFAKFDWKMYQNAIKRYKNMPSALTKKTRPDLSIQVDLHRYIQSCVQEPLLEQLCCGNLGIYVSNSLVEVQTGDCRQWYDIESSAYAKDNLSLQHLKTPEYAFVLCFERDRLGLNLDEIFNNETPTILSTACERLFSKTKTKHPHYLSALRTAEANEARICTAIFYRAKLNANGLLELLEPQRADDKRIYRLYGSDRFLEVAISNDVSNETIKHFLAGEVSVANRCFEFFWFKREAGIHPVLFAVSGQGIENVSVKDARDRCIPSKYNRNISLGKWVKRMKLNFSTTTATCILPPNCVDVVKDFEDDGVAQIDGAGLISSKALQAVWDGYTKRTDSICPFSGFQGRLAG